jgi:hypothetical protein
MDQHVARLVPRAGALAVVVFALVAVGYLGCLGILLICPSIVPEPVYWSLGPSVLADPLDGVLRLSTVSLGYWMTATLVAIGVALVISLLAGRALTALGELAQSASGENR